MMQSPTSGTFMRMVDQLTGEVQKDSLQPLMLRSLYQIMGQSVVIPAFYEKAKLAYLPGENPEGQELEDALIVKVTSNGEERNLHCLVIKVFVSIKNQFELGGLYFFSVWFKSTIHHFLLN